MAMSTCVIHGPHGHEECHQCEVNRELRDRQTRPDGLVPIMDDEGKPTGYFRDPTDGQIYTVDDEWDEADDQDN